jgi:hypothetical protein
MSLSSIFGLVRYRPLKLPVVMPVSSLDSPPPPNGSTAPWEPRPPHFSRLHDNTLFFRHATLGRTPLDEGPARRRDLPDNTKHSQETDIHALGEIRTHNSSKRAAVDPRLRLRGHWDRQ